MGKELKMKNGMVAALSVFVAMQAAVALADNSRLVAHRGDASRFPQNTLEAIKSAVEHGAGMIEIDVVQCKTGELVVYGERDLEEVTDGAGPVKDDYDVQLFSDMATVEDNMKSLRHALNVTGSHRVAQLRTTMYDSSFWSLFIVNRHEVRTYCQILPPAPPAKGN